MIKRKVYAMKTKILIDSSMFEVVLHKAYRIVICVIHKEKTMKKLKDGFIHHKNSRLRFLIRI